jgi:hypothetical protein
METIHMHRFMFKWDAKQGMIEYRDNQFRGPPLVEKAAAIYLLVALTAQRVRGHLKRTREISNTLKIVSSAASREALQGLGQKLFATGVSRPVGVGLPIQN